MANFSRLGTSTMYENTISTLSTQQKQLADQMEKMSSGKRVVRPSDDPVAAAQAERARTRLSRIEVDQRALAAQTETIAYGESTLGQINSTLIEFRTLMLQTATVPRPGQPRKNHPGPIQFCRTAWPVRQQQRIRDHQQSQWCHGLHERGQRQRRTGHSHGQPRQCHPQ